MGSQEVILLGCWFSPCSHRVQWALKLKGIHYQFMEEDISKKSPFLLKHNPVTKKIPVLIHDGKAIVDSLSIIEYIDETWNHVPMLLPPDPYEKAMARFWADFIEGKVKILINT
ncbi:probable glutathione S-transferase isoform X5 [Ricinus communis]|uniref:probable glutathione S-transferase isoform X5 n=1 Tax=Ricinus communis TaxID=3988 RepID=UPI00201A6A67|nr:probable glutathione S-transferase isoform X5 [Ricinus communis]